MSDAPERQPVEEVLLQGDDRPPRRPHSTSTPVIAAIVLSALAFGGFRTLTSGDDSVPAPVPPPAPSATFTRPTPKASALVEEAVPVPPLPKPDAVSVRRPKIARYNHHLQIAPPRIGEDLLNWTPTGLPEFIRVEEPAPPIWQDPPKSALAVLQHNGYPGDVLFVGDDGQLRAMGGALNPDYWLDLAYPAVRPHSLRNDGLRAAFPQPDAVVVTDITDGTSRRYAVPGPHDDVRWLPDDRTLLVSGWSGSVLLDTVTGRTRPTQLTMPDALFADDGSPVQVEPADSRLTGWTGTPAWRDGVVARAARMEQVHEAGVPVAPDAVAAFDARDGSLIRALVFAEAGLERPGQCCPVLGWLDDTTVVFASNGDGPTRLLAWDTESLTITRVTEFEAGTLVSLAQLARATRLIGLERD